MFWESFFDFGKMDKKNVQNGDTQKVLTDRKKIFDIRTLMV